MDNKLIYIIRHGETDFNKLGIVQGSGVNQPLNETGVKQALGFYKMYKQVNFNKIYTSALVRTQQSVLPFIEAGHKHNVIAELNEISWGVLEGKRQTAAQKAIYMQVVNQWNSGNYLAKIANGESALELQNRVAIAAKKIFTSSLPQTALICMHGRAMKAFLCYLLNKPLAQMDNFVHTNLGVYILEFNGNTFNLITQNCTEHLKNI